MYVHRPYSASQGRFLSRDPLGDEAFLRTRFSIASESKLKRLEQQALLPPYLFVHNDPIARFDVLGLYNNCCCDANTIQNGKDWLISRYNSAKIYLEPYRPNPMPEDTGWSCLGVSLAISHFMAPTPHCWTCYVADHWTRRFGMNWGDLNVIVCESHPKTGKPEKVFFDYWHDSPPAQDYSIFLSSHPDERTPDTLPVRYADCSKSQDWPVDYTQLSPILQP